MVGPSENNEYVIIRPDYEDKGLNEYIKKVIDNLHRRFKAVRCMTELSTVKVYEAKSVPRGCKKLKIDGDCYLDTPTLFDCGSDGAAATEELNNRVSSYQDKDLQRGD